jgi:hypothetical protein
METAVTNQESPPQEAFTRKEIVDKPGIIGARWWNETVAAQIPRRQAMTGLVAIGAVLGAMAMVGTCAVAATRSSTPDFSFEPRAAIDMQRQYGWSFGATGESLVFDGKSTSPFERTTLALIASDLAPSSARYTPYYVRTLFESPTALPTQAVSGDPDAPPFTPLLTALVPISTPAMTEAFERGRALASLLDDPRAKDLAVIVDLPGPEAVAFAAGASSALDPVFLFDNWPHPHGVVPAHLTLAAAAYYQPLFRQAKGARPEGARPMFVLDRKRLAAYADDATQFDNRHTARLPSAANLAALGTKDVLYVGPNAVERQELDDIADDLVAYGSRMTLRLLPATAFAEDSAPAPPLASPAKGAAPAKPGDARPWTGPYVYRGARARHRSAFWDDWGAPARDLPVSELQTYTPRARTTPFSSGGPPSAARTRPPGFGMVPVAIAVGTGAILGAKLSRSGSWNRTSSSSSGS